MGLMQSHGVSHNVKKIKGAAHKNDDVDDTYEEGIRIGNFDGTFKNCQIKYNPCVVFMFFYAIFCRPEQRTGL